MMRQADRLNTDSTVVLVTRWLATDANAKEMAQASADR
jgi:hypothetical protein